MKFASLLGFIASMGGAAIAAHSGRQPPPTLRAITMGEGVHRMVAPSPTGALRIQRAAKKRRNVARHRAHCRGA
jgi:hypothetical protein